MLRLPAEVRRGEVADALHHRRATNASSAGLDAGNGVILALPHLGGWEYAAAWMGAPGPSHARGGGADRAAGAYDWFVAQREAFGLDIVPLGPSVLSTVLQALRDNRIVCLLSDRDLTGDGVEVEFFGERTTLPGGPATLALRTGATLLPAAVYFRPGRNHHAVVRPPVPAAREGRLREDVARITQLLAHEFEALIRAAPEQWHLMQPNWPSDREGSEHVRVVMTWPYSLSRPGGVQGQVLGLARELRQLGVDVRVLAPCDGPPPAPGVVCVGPSVEWISNGSIAPIATGADAARRTAEAIAHDRTARRASARAGRSRTVPQHAHRVRRADGRDVPRVRRAAAPVEPAGDARHHGAPDVPGRSSPSRRAKPRC